MIAKYASWLSYGFQTVVLRRQLPYLFGLVITDQCNLDCFNLLTHWPEILATHGLAPEQRIRLLDDLWRLKQEGYPIVLSRAAYRALRANDWKRPIPQIELGTRDRIFTCCRDVDNPAVCENCGYANCRSVPDARPPPERPLAGPPHGPHLTPPRRLYPSLSPALTGPFRTEKVTARAPEPREPGAGNGGISPRSSSKAEPSPGPPGWIFWVAIFRISTLPPTSTPLAPPQEQPTFRFMV